MAPNTIAAVDNAAYFIIAICIVLFVLIVAAVIFFLVRYRRSTNPSPASIDGNWKLELVWIVAAAAIALGMFYYGLVGFRVLHTAPPGAMEVAVEGAQWSWEFTYANGKQSPDLVVPLGRDVSLTMTTPDVIHGFFAPAYRIKQDIVPGMTTRLWFKADAIGSTDVFCTQYCGEEHSKMLSKIAVISAADFERWYAGESVVIPGVTDTDTGAQ